MMTTTLVHSADWVLDATQSQLNFVSIKKGSVAEIHQFQNIQGSLDSEGQLKINIDLSSVDTNIDIRNERLKTFLFEIDKFTTATLTATIAPSILDAIPEGGSARITVDSTLNLHGESEPLEIDVVITRLVGAKLSAVSVTPIIINAGNFSLIAGIDKLMALAKLPSISHAIPVNFYLTFSLKRD